MKIHCSVTLVILLFIINPSIAETKPISEIPKSHQWIIPNWLKSNGSELKLESPMILAGILCFLSASISSAGGIGGGGLYIPILTIIAGVDLKTASSFSAFMVTGGSIANVICNLLSASSRFGGKPLIDYDIALLSEPSMLLGVSIGVICNLVFPEWLITILFALFLAWCTTKTCNNGVQCWRFESELVRRTGVWELEKGFDEIEGSKSRSEEPLLGSDEDCKLGFPWMNLGVLVLVWFCFFGVYLLRGNRSGQSITQIEPCGVAYWILSSLQIPLAIISTAWVLYRKDSLQYQDLSVQDKEDLTRSEHSSKLIFPIMGLLAGILGGVFGIGGGMLISPLLLQVGIKPEITAGTCSFMVFFSSSMSAIQYSLLGMEHTGTALTFAFICFIASLIGLIILQRAIQKFGRASLIVFSISTVMALSTVLMTSFGALDVWRDYTSGKYMGFKLPC